MKVFLTGSRGFISNHLSKMLIELGHYVYDAHYDEMPIDDDYDVVIHLAATTTLSKEFNPALFHNNITYPENLFSSFRGKIIYASSTSAAELTNPYAYTKRYLEYLGGQHGNAVGLRFFNVYGPGNNKGIIKRAIDCALSGETLFLSGGDHIRDFIYIDDVVNWICNNLDHKPGIVDIGRGCGMTIREAVSKVAEATNKAIYTRTFPPSDVDMKMSIAEPGIPGISLEEGLKKMLCEY